MKNVTISMDDELAQRARVAAARAGKSVSKYMAEATKARIDADERASAENTRNFQLEAIQRFLAGPKLNVSENGRMPSAEERNFRSWQRDIR